jgi:hypothetical protein
MQDIDDEPGIGAFLGEVHVNVLNAMGCVGAVTNGAARELPGIEAMGFQVLPAGSPSPALTSTLLTLALRSR